MVVEIDASLTRLGTDRVGRDQTHGLLHVAQASGRTRFATMQDHANLLYREEHRAISDGLRQEDDRIRVTCVCPGVVESELADSISDEKGREDMKGFCAIALKPEAIAAAILHAVLQPTDVDTTEIVARPVASPQ